MWKDIEYITNLIYNSDNKTDVLNKLLLKNNGGNYNTLTTFINKNGINIDHFHNKKLLNVHSKKDLKDVFENKMSYSGTNHLKERLYKEGFKQRICEICGQNENWNGNHISLILDHINGNRYNNSLENLRIVCPNCNATLETHCRGMNISIFSRHDLCICGNRKRKDSKMCKPCYNLLRSNNKVIKKVKEDINPTRKRKVQRPPYAKLLSEVSKLGYVKTGKIYGVSDNSIRKWIRMYEKYGENF